MNKYKNSYKKYNESYIREINPYLEIGDISNIVSDYSGGLCDVNTESGTNCWQYIQTSTANNNCDNFCLENMEHWLFTLFHQLMNMDTNNITLHAITNEEKDTKLINLSHVYKNRVFLEIQLLNHPILNAIRFFNNKSVPTIIIKLTNDLPDNIRENIFQILQTNDVQVINYLWDHDSREIHPIHLIRTPRDLNVFKITPIAEQVDNFFEQIFMQLVYYNDKEIKQIESNQLEHEKVEYEQVEHKQIVMELQFVIKSQSSLSGFVYILNQLGLNYQPIYSQTAKSSTRVKIPSRGRTTIIKLDKEEAAIQRMIQDEYSYISDFNVGELTLNINNFQHGIYFYEFSSQISLNLFL